MDFDGDGTPDLLSGSWPGELYFFRGLGEGKFEAGKTLEHKDGKPIKPDSATTVFAYDWRGTGKLDLLVGSIAGRVYLVPNEGTRDKPSYGEPVKLQADGKEIMATHGDSHPVVADWEGTGKPGLVVGCGDGSVVWYANVGKRKAPELAAGRVLVPAGTMGTGDKADKPVRGSRAKVCVADWNGDGRADLLVGDFAMSQGAKPELTEAQKEEEKELRAKVAALQKKLQPYYEEVDKVARDFAGEKDLAKRREAMSKALEEVRKRHQEVLDEQTKLYMALQKYQPEYQYHGHVWLFLRKPAGEDAAER